MVNSLPALPTIGAIAERCGVPPEVVERKIRELRLKPVARAGIARVFSLDVAERICRELAAARRGEESDDDHPSR